MLHFVDGPLFREAMEFSYPRFSHIPELDHVLVDGGQLMESRSFSFAIPCRYPSYFTSISRAILHIIHI